MDEWRRIEDLPYSVNYSGEVRNDRTGKILKPNKTAGYYQVRLWVNRTIYYRLVHRLVASAFVENKDGKQEVNHKDGDKTNNNANNLEWVTRSENQVHRYRVLLRRGHNHSTKEAVNATKKMVVCEETGEVFESVTCAAKSVGRSQPALSNYLRKRQGTFAGMHWRFVC